MTSETSPSSTKTVVRQNFHRKLCHLDLAASWNCVETYAAVGTPTEILHPLTGALITPPAIHVKNRRRIWVGSRSTATAMPTIGREPVGSQWPWGLAPPPQDQGLRLGRCARVPRWTRPSRSMKDAVASSTRPLRRRARHHHGLSRWLRWRRGRVIFGFWWR